MNLSDEEEIQEMLEPKINPINQEEDKNANPKEDNNIKEKYKNLNLSTRKWRVKLYRLNENGQWDDWGIGYVFCANSQNETGKEINKLIMTNEINEEEMLNIDIDGKTADFHNQRGTIMTWKTGDDDKGDDNIAISFQEKEGVIEIMKKMYFCEGKNFNDESLNNFMDNQSDTSYEISIQNLPNLVRELNFDMGEQKLMNFINNLKNNNCDFIVKLGELLKEEEKKNENLKTTASSNITNINNNTNTNINTNTNSDKNNDTPQDKNIIINENNNNKINNEYNQQQIYKSKHLENIHYIFTIFKNLILIGEKDLIEILMKDEYYLITFGALEYDFETMKTVPHRKYFKDIVKFKNPLNIQDQDILKKINQNLRLSYLRDTALSRLIDDNAIKAINLILQFNHNDIIQFFLNDIKYFEILFNQLQNEDLNIKKESCLFLSELIECSKDVLQSRVTFSECLFEQGILLVIGKIIEDNKNNENLNNLNIKNDKDLEIKEFIKITAVEIFINILTTIPNIILDYLKKEKDHKLLKQLTNIMLYSDNFGIKYEIGQIYKTLIETQLKEQSMDRMELFAEPFQSLLNYIKKPIKEGEQAISHKKKMEIASTKQIIIEILITWLSLMSFNKQFWVDENKIEEIIANLLEDNDKVINLHSIKLLKCIIDYTDPFVCNKIITEKLCNNLSKLFSKNIKKNNIIISCMMDFFESLSKNKQMIFNNIMTYQSDFFYQNKKYFKNILLRYENKPTPKRELINFLKNDYKDNESLFLYDFDFKDVGELYDGEDEKIIDYLSKKREREYNDDCFDTLGYEHEHKKYNSNNDYYNNRMEYGNKDDYDDENDDDIKKGFLPDLRVNEKNEDNINNDNENNNFHF